MIRDVDYGRVHRPLVEGWPPYSDADFARIAEAIGKPVSDIHSRRAEFEKATFWYQFDMRSPRRMPPSAARLRLEQTAKAARKLLRHLGIYHLRDAPDGPADISIFDALSSVDGQSDEKILSATAKLGRLVEILEGKAAIEELERTAMLAAQDVTALGELIVPKEHRGDEAANAWLKRMMELYTELTGKKPAVSVKPPGPDRGDVGGPFIRFLQAAGTPIGIEYPPKAWRRRIRTTLEQASSQK